METRVPMGTVKIESIGERDWPRVIGEYVTVKGEEAYPALCKTVREDWLQMGEGAARGKMQDINAEVVHDEGRC